MENSIASILSSGFEMRSVIEANMLESKLEFIISLMDRWSAGGGIGCLPPEAQKLQWEGPQLASGKKPDWITVGRFGGDTARA